MESITVYTLAELKESFPEAFERVHERWRECVAQDSLPWVDETMDSLKAVIDACGGTLRDWNIGAGDPLSYLRVDVSEPEDVRQYMLQKVLRPNGYVKKNGHADFPGYCKFTGYCADDDFLEHVWKRVNQGDTLQDALQSLADVASYMMEDDLEQQQSEESMMANWGDVGCKYTEDGTEV